MFSYEYHHGSTGLGEEPEGLDWWNQEAIPGSRYPGQLHAILLDNQLDDSNVWLKHYTVLYSCVLGDDTDGDGLTDGGEAYGFGTHPLLADTDADAQEDGPAVACGSDPLDSATLAPYMDADGSPDCVDADDGDAVPDGSDLCPSS